MGFNSGFKGLKDTRSNTSIQISCGIVCSRLLITGHSRHVTL